MYDHRDYADINLEPYVDSKDEEQMILVLKLEDYEDEEGNYFEEATQTFPLKYEVCPTCEGRGKHVNPNVDRNGITASEMHEMGPEFQEDYFSGLYDVTCSGCCGKRVLTAVDDRRLDESQKHFLKAVNSEIEADHEFRSVERAERRMGY